MGFLQRNREPKQGAQARGGQADAFAPSLTGGQGAQQRQAGVPRLSSRELRKKRSAEFVQAVGSLDAGLDEQTRARLAAWIADQYVTEYGGAIPVGLMAACHLGPPYVDHRLSLLETILEHYGPFDPVPEPFAAARPLVRSGAYVYVEIYSNGVLVAVRPDGTVVTP